MAPSLFNNEYSRGPLYQYWKERSQEERELRSQRVQDADLRSKGHQPLSATYGPSSNNSYTRRATSGPPAYTDSSITNTGESNGQQPGDLLPAYDSAVGCQHGEDQAGHGEPAILTAEEEKARLQQIDEQNRQIRDDEAIARTLSRDDAEEVEAPPVDRTDDEQVGPRKGKARKIGRWFADAATGYTAKQERW